MLPLHFFIGAGIVFILILLGVLFLIPDKAKEEKKKKQQAAEEQKNWKQTAMGMEKHIQTLKTQMDALQKESRDKDKELAAEKIKCQKLQEKIAQQREWEEKEQAIIDKRTADVQQLKAELAAIQDQLAREHVDKLRMEREFKEFKSQIDLLNEQRRLAESQGAQFKAQGEAHQREITLLKRENIELVKKNQDTVWIAKSEYMKLEHQLKDAERQLEEFRRSPK